MWYILAVVAKMMDNPQVTLWQQYHGNLSKHGVAWGVHCMTINHHVTRIKPQNANTEFLQDIMCPGFLVTAEVELGMLTNDISAGSQSSRLEYDMPERFELRQMAARIFTVSPKFVTTVKDLARPTLMNRMR